MVTSFFLAHPRNEICRRKTNGIEIFKMRVLLFSFFHILFLHQRFPKMIIPSNPSQFDFPISTLYVDKSFKLLWLVPIASSSWFLLSTLESGSKKFNVKVDGENKDPRVIKKKEGKCKTELKAAKKFNSVVCSRCIDLISREIRNIWRMSLLGYKYMVIPLQLNHFLLCVFCWLPFQFVWIHIFLSQMC